MKCEHCQHYQFLNEVEGNCHFNPPVPDAQMRGQWVVVFKDDRCGRYSSKE